MVARVLVVDDEPSLLFLSRLALELAGHEVAEATHGAAALEQLRSAKFDAVVSDVMMPVLDGLELLREIRADDELCDLPVILYTSMIRPVSDADAVLQKPAQPDELVAAVEDALKEKA